MQCTLTWGNLLHGDGELNLLFNASGHFNIPPSTKSDVLEFEILLPNGISMKISKSMDTLFDWSKRIYWNIWYLCAINEMYGHKIYLLKHYFKQR